MRSISISFPMFKMDLLPELISCIRTALYLAGGLVATASFFASIHFVGVFLGRPLTDPMIRVFVRPHQADSRQHIATSSFLREAREGSNAQPSGRKASIDQDRIPDFDRLSKAVASATAFTLCMLAIMVHVVDASSKVDMTKPHPPPSFREVCSTTIKGCIEGVLTLAMLNVLLRVIKAIQSGLAHGSEPSRTTTEQKYA